MDMITVSAKTLDEAITKASIELGTISSNMEYTIIEKGSAGLLGFIGSKPVVIKAKRKKEEDELFEDMERERNKPVKVEVPVTAEVPVKKEIKKETVVKQDVPVKKEIVKKPEVKPVVEQVAVEKPVQPVQPETPKKPVNSEALERSAKTFLTQIFAAMNMEVEIKTVYDDSERELCVDMSGADMGILIGKRGQTLDSLQYLVSLVVNKDCEGYIRVKLDTENYRSRRKDTLESLAKNIAYKVKRTRKSVSLEPMNPYERRIIHATLQNDKYVVTRSEGEDPFRHVVISLKREGRNNQQ